MGKPLLAATALVAVLAGQAGLPDPPKGPDLLRMWLTLAKQHVPGEADDSVSRLRRFSLGQLAEVQTGLEALTEFLKDPGLTRLRRPREYSDTEQHAIAEIAAAVSAGGSANVLLRQIALLHADAMALRGAVTFVVDTTAASSTSDVTLVSDGVGLGGARMPPLWPIARMAIEAIQPRPAADAWARHWYRATTAFLFYSFQLAVLPAHLEARRAVMPEDAGAIFDMGCLYEAFASERVLAVARSERARGFVLDVPAPEAALARARREFEDAIARDPGLVEARVRRARVMARLGESRAAAEELASIAANVDTARDIRYFASLFLGDVRWSLGDSTGAATAYDAALKLYPRAQSPAVGLLLVRPRSTDPDLERIETALKAAPVDRLDPWFDYHLGPGRRADADLDVLWRAFIAK